ncbi:MAG: helix-turn-helix transcriptional regulator [Actinobacteria bacterium]|nr:helix-turn-helix transcriptional regulator [Actinomycetota bacterium]
MDLRDLRKNYNCSQAKLGAMAKVGQDTISNIENFKQEMSMDTAIKLSPFLGDIDPLELCFKQVRGLFLKRLIEAEQISEDRIKKVGLKTLTKLLGNLSGLLNDDFVIEDKELVTKLLSIAIKISNVLKDKKRR